jgi:hypothetical protein
MATCIIIGQIVFVCLHGSNKQLLCLHLAETICSAWCSTRHVNCWNETLRWTLKRVFIKSWWLINYDGMKAYGGVEVFRSPFLTPPQDGSESPTQHCPNDPHEKLVRWITWPDFSLRKFSHLRISSNCETLLQNQTRFSACWGRSHSPLTR